MTATPTEPPSDAPRPVRRFWARHFDGFLALTALTVAATIRSPSSVVADDAPLVLGFVALALWVPVEALLLATWGTTPGKALLNVRVATADGRRPSLWTALSRSTIVWLFGSGAGVPLVSWILMGKAHTRLTETGVTAWDERLGLDARTERMTPVRIAVAVGCTLVLMTALGATQAVADARSGASTGTEDTTARVVAPT